MSTHLSLALNYTASMHEFYQKLSHLPGFVLLESSDRVRGRYDIVSAYPYDQIRVEHNAVNMEKQIEELNARLLHYPSVADLPFQGGAIGYISYDFGERLAGICSTPQPSLRAMPLLDLGLYDWAIIVDHQLQKTTFFAANTQDNTPELIIEILSRWNGDAVPDSDAWLINNFKPLGTPQEYQKSFASIRESLIAGRSYQVNLTQPFHADYTGDCWQFYKNVILKNPVPFSAFLRLKDADILSFSPERFLLYEEGMLITSPIKGTIGRSSDLLLDDGLKQELSASSKNRAENVMIVDLLRNDLGKIAKPGTVEVPSLCAIESYRSVHHLVSTIHAELLPSIKPFDAFLSCFPGGSITGAPKLESMRIIHEQEAFARGVYCGAIGYFSRHGRFETNIAIRTLIARANILHLAAGGGLVIDSNSEEEYEECFIKIAAIIDGLK